MSHLDSAPLPTGWQWARLGEVCQINPRLTEEQTPASDAEVTFVPMSAVDGIEGRIAWPERRIYSQVSKGYTPFCEGDVLFAKITPCMQNGKAAIATQLCNGLGFGSTEFHVLRPGPNVVAEWIFAFVRQPSFRATAEANFTGTAGQQRVPADFMARARIAIPPLSEQRRIADILHQADGLRHLRREADARAQQLLPSLFREMFGDPLTNPKGWKLEPLGKFISFITSGSRGWAKYYSTQGAKFIRVQNMTGHRLNVTVQLVDMAHNFNHRPACGELRLQFDLLVHSDSPQRKGKTTR